ncbi:MAG TPA: sugar O-acetyltransferase [Anaerolineae bacterium]|nr:sugar O-acetyltransferase [Anaerolineae bacterium]
MSDNFPPDTPNLQKMAAGQPYLCLDPILLKRRGQIRAKLHALNNSITVDDIRHHLGRLLGHLGPHALIDPPFHCTYGHNIHLGQHSYLNVNCVIVDNNTVHIGAHVMMGPAVQIYTAAHDLDPLRRADGWEIAKPITINDYVWIGGNATILPGLTIGHNAVVGAGAVVTKDVPPNTVVAGNPARIIRQLPPADNPPT